MLIYELLAFHYRGVQMLFDKKHQNLIEDVFGGDADALLTSIKKSTSETLDWKHVHEDVTTLPHYEPAANFIIELWLGYLPPKHFRIKEEIRLKKLINEYENFHLEEKVFFEQCSIIVKCVRNNEMVEHCEHYSAKLFQDYNDYLPEYADAAKDRITRILSYEPKLEHSAKAEIIIREAFASDHFHFPEDKPTTTDLQVVNIIKYREVLCTQGKNAALNSKLHVNDIKKNFK